MYQSFIEVHVNNISLTKMGFVVLLKPIKEERILPIFVGAAESHAIMTVLNNEPFPRPLTHDLFKNFLTEIDWNIEEVRITELHDNTFYGQIHYCKGEEKLEMDARPSDAIAMALRYKAPILVHSDIIQAAGVFPENEEGKGTSKETATPNFKELEKLSPLEKLRVDLELAIAEERYEEASKIRDKMRNLESGN